MLTADFDYHLPPERIAQSPVLPRDSCRLLVLHRADKTIEHRRFSDILHYLNAGDLLVVNETKVMPARLLGRKRGGGAAVELLLLRQLGDDATRWQALVSPGRRLKPGTVVELCGLTVRIEDWVANGGRGERVVVLETEGGESVASALRHAGQLPLPPYIHNYRGDSELYQTVYATTERSAAAPTAGLHFTAELLQQLRDKGVDLATVDLEVGLDTFRSVSAERIEDHVIHSEFFSLPTASVQAVADTRARGGRVIAVGTTSVRALESAWDKAGASLRPVKREQTELYIRPGFSFQVTDALITNFHTPRSTLLMLVSAFAGRKNVLAAYEQALAAGYRFLSFGDAMLVQ
jgi:S-adenosylmethionine:tRNA ribosyltransferase-isomerase